VKVMLTSRWWLGASLTLRNREVRQETCFTDLKG
jgi:hypothetical protein